MKANIKLSATLLRNILTGTIVLLFIASGIGFYFFNNKLEAFSTEVNSDNTAAASSSQDVSQLQHLQREMANDQVATTRAKSIVADSKYYQYQNQVIDDLSAYAAAAGFQIEQFSFQLTPTGTAAASVPGSVAPAGLKISYATIVLPKDLPYPVIMTFMKSIEQNLTKMELTGISFSVDSGSGKIETQPITIGVYTR